MKLERDDRGFLRVQIYQHQLDNANFDVVEHIRQRMRERKMDLQLPEELQIVEPSGDGHYIDDPLAVVNAQPDFSGVGLDNI